MLNRISAAFLFFAFLSSSFAAIAATPEEAKILLSEAVAFYKANGKDKTFTEINNPNGKFSRGELYIFVYDSNGRTAAHGADSDHIGLDVMNLKDENGKYFGREMMQIGDSGGSVDYVWPNPLTGKVQKKTSYVILVDGFRFGCGIYKE
ncbi:MAG: cytochrome c [Gammaproteobacteria bacterium]|jgi:cytochrome c